MRGGHEEMDEFARTLLALLVGLPAALATRWTVIGVVLAWLLIRRAVKQPDEGMLMVLPALLMAAAVSGISEYFTFDPLPYGQWPALACLVAAFGVRAVKRYTPADLSAAGVAAAMLAGEAEMRHDVVVFVIGATVAIAAAALLYHQLPPEERK